MNLISGLYKLSFNRLLCLEFYQYGICFIDFCVYKGVPLRQGEVFRDGCTKVCRCEDVMLNSVVCDDRSVLFLPELETLFLFYCSPPKMISKYVICSICTKLTTDFVNKCEFLVMNFVNYYLEKICFS